MVQGWRAMGWRVGRQEAVARGLRVFVAMSSVMALGGWLGQPQILIPLLLGVIAGALAESDGSWRGQLRAQAVTLLSFGLVGLAVQASLHQADRLVAVLCVAAWGLTLLGALGERFRSLAFATLIMAIYAVLASDTATGHAAPRWPLLWLLGGTAWYGLIAVLWAAALPLLPVQQKLATLYETLDVYLRLKARLLAPVRDIDLARGRLALALHNGRVVEALNAVKESLFLRQGAGLERMTEALHLYFVAQDLHERVSSSHEHYEVLADAFFHSDVLYRCQRVLATLGADCLSLAASIPWWRDWRSSGETARAVQDLDAAIAVQAADAPGTPAPLHALRALADNLLAAVDDLRAVPAGLPAGRLPADATLHNRHPRTLREVGQRLRAHLTLSSLLMRHAIRLSVALLAGDLVMRWTGDRHGLWILLTIVFVCQPQYGATVARLVQRIGGTVLGLMVGWALLRLFPGVLVQSGFTVLAGALFFVTRPTHYTLATASATSLVLLSFNQVGNGFDLIVPRLVDTLAGSLISVLALWLVLPGWQSRQLHRVAAQTLRAQAAYLQEIMRQYRDGRQDHLVYRLARRNAHNADAALSGTMGALFLEPAIVSRHTGAGTRFLILSHTLLNHLSALGAHRGESVGAGAAAAAEPAVRHLLEALEQMAGALERREVPPPPGPRELALLLGLSRAGERVPALLAPLLRQLAPLRRAAAALVTEDGPGGRADPTRLKPPESLPVPDRC